MKRIICALISLLVIFGNCAVYAETSETGDYIKTLEVGSPFNYRNLTIAPVYAKTVKDKTDYATLDEAVKKGYITVTELEGGRVPQVKITNNSDRYILLVAGEIITGCRQDRLVGKDALIAPGSKNLILPVYCSEQGRWTYKSQQFASEESQAEPHLRGMIYKGSSQSEIWSGIAHRQNKLGVKSDTQAFQDVYRSETVSKKIRGYVERLENLPRLEDDAVGVVVGLGEKVIGIDLFANPSIFSRLWPKLLKSYAALAVSEEEEAGTLTQKQAKDTLNEVYRAKFSRQPGIDLGEELQANASGMVCSALVYRAGVIHLGVFPGEGKDDPVIYRNNHNSRMQVID